MLCLLATTVLLYLIIGIPSQKKCETDKNKFSCSHNYQWTIARFCIVFNNMANKYSQSVTNPIKNSPFSSHKNLVLAHDEWCRTFYSFGWMRMACHRVRIHNIHWINYAVSSVISTCSLIQMSAWIFSKVSTRRRSLLSPRVPLGKHVYLAFIRWYKWMLSSFFFSDERRQEQWTKAWPKVKGVYTRIESICKALQVVAKQCNRDSIAVSFTRLDMVSASTPCHHQLAPSFMYTHWCAIAKTSRPTTQLNCN